MVKVKQFLVLKLIQFLRLIKQMKKVDIPISVVYAGAVGILASLLVGMGEFSLHYTPTNVYSSDYHFFLDVSKTRLTFGHFITIYAIPLYYIGYWHLFKMLQPVAYWIRALFFSLGVFSFSVATAWIGSRVYLALMIQAEQASTNPAMQKELGQLLETFSFYNETILSVVRIGIALVSLMFVILILSKKTVYPRYFALFNPILLVIACFILYYFVPAIGGYLMPEAMNVAHFVLFSCSTVYAYKLYRNKKDLT